MGAASRRKSSSMPKKNKPTAGPMKTQPIERVSIMPTPVQSMMPTVGLKAKKKLQPIQKPSRVDAVRSAMRRIEGLVLRDAHRYGSRRIYIKWSGRYLLNPVPQHRELLVTVLR
jgi:hypothetical protein